jgi:hypothetical protein
VIRRIVRIVLHLAGWLLTPIAAVLAAAIGATIGMMIAPRLTPTGGLLAGALGGLAGATVGLWLWLRLLRRSPVLQDVLAVTPEGVPTPDALDDVIGPESPHPGSDR